MASLGNNLGLQGVTVTPRFIFGVNGENTNNLHIVDDKKLMYVAGHNVVIYNPDEKTQQFIPGSENVEGINFITVSNTNTPHLAICERAKRAQVTIVGAIDRKVKKTVPDPNQEDAGFTATEFLTAAFSPKDDKKLIVLAGEPDWCLIMWEWQKFGVLAKVPLHIQEPVVKDIPFNISFPNTHTEL